MKSIFSSVVFRLVLFFLLFTSNAYSGQATLIWDPPEVPTDVSGYKVDYGTASGTYAQGIDVGNTTSHTISNLPDGQTYYFAVVAYNSAGSESGYSNEVSKTMDILQSPLTILKAGTGTGVISGMGISCGSACSTLYKQGTVVSLSSAADSGSTFSGWSGGGCSGTGLCATTINGATTITAAFNKSTASYVITAAVNGTGGAISPSGTSSVNSGENKTFTIAPNTGYSISGVIVDGQSVGAVANYTFSNIAANHTIAATFTVKSYVVTATVSGTGGIISPSGTQSVNDGGSKTFTISPKTFYRVADVTVDGKSVGAVSRYTISNVTAKHTITATFKRRW
jgi:hypothetical protein